jgi:hypothetical protein
MDKRASKNEPTDRTVDEKLGRWREKSIKLEEERKLEEESKKNQTGVKKWLYLCSKMRDEKKGVIAAGAGIVVVLAVLLVCILGSGKINLSKYVYLEYTGANGYASAECIVDTEKLYTKLAGKTDDAAKLKEYRDFADSVSAQTDASDIKNGSKLTINVTYDAQLAKQLGISFKKTSYSIKAEGIDSGTQIDLYSNVEVVFAGVSPKAYLVIANKWTDDYLKGLTFTADKSDNIAKGDEIVISCSDDYAEIARHGYVVKTDKAKITADELSVYAENKEQLDKTLLSTIDKETKSTIVSETEDVTFRMLYQATKESSYLRNSNEETVDDIQNLGIYFLKQKSGSEETDNYLYYLYRATISDNSAQEDVYFLFEYKNGYVTKDSVFDIDYGAAVRTYYCAVDSEELYEECIKTKENVYTITKVE